MKADQILSDHYSPDIQISIGQAHAIISAITAAGPDCRMLVFGCGNDSDLWHSANSTGKTVFIENHPKWIEKTRSRFPHLDIRMLDYGDRSVATSLPIRERDLEAVPMPSVLLEEEWDVILVDAPMGHRDDAPGRSLPIYWASKVASGACQVFVDDYERPLERSYANHFLNSVRTWNAVIPRISKDGVKSDGEMLWSMGSGPKESQSKPHDRGAVILLLDSAYLPGLRALAYSIRNAIAEDTHDIVVVTNDPAVGDDPLVRKIAAKVVHLSDEQIAGIRRVDSSLVQADFRHESLGKYTFLKFYTFQDLGYSHHIFLDVDMVCLDPNFSFNDLLGDYDFAAAPTMGSRFLADSSTESSSEVVYERIRRLMRRRIGLGRSFNSGLFVAGKLLLSEKNVEKLIKIGESEASRLEQIITQKLVVNTPGVRFRSLPAGYNFVYLAALKIGQKRFEELGRKVKFLHYNSKTKPWQEGFEPKWLGDIWMKFSSGADAWVKEGAASPEKESDL